MRNSYPSRRVFRPNLALLSAALASAVATTPLPAAEPLATASATSAAGDWPQWRGPRRDDISSETGLLQTWPEGGPKQAWGVKGLGAGYSSVSVAGGKIFTMGDAEDACNLIALNESDGKPAWSTKVAAPSNRNDEGGYPGPRCTPTVDGDRVYALGQKGDLICAKSADGGEVWCTNLARDLGGKMMSGWGYAESPLVDGDKLVCTPGGSKGTLAAFDKKSGKLLWRSTALTDAAAYASLVPVDIAGIHQVIVLTANHVAGVAVDDGRVLWQGDRKGGTAVIPTPIFHDDYVFVTSGYSAGCQLFHVSGSSDSLKAEEVYSSKEMSDHHGGVVLVGDYLYGSADPGILKCMEFKTGKVVWKDRAPGKGSITYADHRLYFRNENGPGTLFLIDASPEAYKEVGHFNQPQRSDRNSWPHPVISHGKLYVRDQGVLLCYDVKQG